MVITLTDTVGGLPFSGTDYNNNLATLETAFVNVPDLTAANTFTAEPQIFSATPTATANRGVVNIGGGGFTGGANHFAGSANGTLLAVNSAAAFTGNLIDLQVGGSGRFSVTATAGVLVGGDFKVSGSYKGTNNPVKFALTTLTPAADADVTVTATEAESLFLRLNTGAWTAGHNVILATTTGGLYVLHNNTAFSAVFKTAAGTGVTVAAGKYCWVWCGGANWIRITPDT